MSTVRALMFGTSTDGQQVPLLVDKTGSASRRSNTAWTYAGAEGGITNTSDVTLKAAAGIGNGVYLTGLQIVNKGGTATEVVVKSGSTVLWRTYAAANGANPINVAFPDPLVADNNTALTAACITTSSATIISAQGYTDIAYPQLQALATTTDEIFADDGTLLLDDSGNTLTIN